MKVNGQQMEWKEQMSIAQLLKQQGYNPLRVAVECNEEIIPKTEYESVFLSEADELEIVSFVGGG